MDLSWVFCLINNHDPIVVKKGNDAICQCEHCKVQMQYTDGQWIKGDEPFVKNIHKE